LLRWNGVITKQNGIDKTSLLQLPYPDRQPNYRDSQMTTIYYQNKLIYIPFLILVLLFSATGCQKAPSTDTDIADKYYRLAQQHFKRGEYSEAIRYLNTIDTQDEDLQAIRLYNLARCYRMLERYEQAYGFYYKVYQSFPTSNLADDALAMSAGMLYNQGKYKDALETYVKVFKEYPDTDVPAIRIWESMGSCLEKFKEEKGYFISGEQRIPAAKFLSLALDVSHHRNSYTLLDRYSFWEDYLKRYRTNQKFRLEYIQRLLTTENFLEAQKQKNRLSRETWPIGEYLEICKLFRINNYDAVIERTTQWLRDYKEKATKSLVSDCSILRIESLMKRNVDNLILINEINDLFKISRNTGFYYILRMYHKLNVEDLLTLADNQESSSLVFFLLAQKYLDLGDLKESQVYLKQAIAKLSTGEMRVGQRSEVLDEMYTILNGYYDSLNKKQFQGVLTNKFKRLLNRAGHFNEFAGYVLNNHEREIVVFLTSQVEKSRNIKELLEYSGPFPAYDEFVSTVFKKTRTFKNLSKVFASRKPWQDKLKEFATYRINEPPSYTEEYYLNNFYYEAVKLIYLIYMKAGFSLQTRNALFLEHMAFLNKQGVFGVYGDFGVDYESVEETSAFDEVGFYDESGNKLITYSRYNRYRNQESKLKPFSFTTENILKAALRRVKKGSQEYWALQAYIDGSKIDKLDSALGH